LALVLGPNNISTNHKYAEKHFAGFCAAAGAVCTPPDSDENGWDFLVELPAEVRDSNLPSDMRPKPQKVFVQVKSTSADLQYCQIKLSNVLKACQSNLPWFIVFYKLNSRSEVRGIYLSHFGSDKIKSGLEAVRASETRGIELHKKKLRFYFAPEMECQSRLLDQMKQLIVDFGPDYEMKKSKLYQEVGYENGFGSGSITIKASDFRDIEPGMLGLGNGLRATKFNFVPERFGIPFEGGRIELEHGTLQIQPTPHDCKVVVTGQSGDSLTIDGKIYSSGLPVSGPNARAIRVSFAGVEAVGTVGSDFTLDVGVDPFRIFSIRELRFHSGIRSSSGESEFDVKIWWEGKPLLALTMITKFQGNHVDWRSLDSLLAFVEGIAGEVNLQTVRISATEVIDAWRDLQSQKCATSQQNIFLQFNAGDVPVAKYDEVVYYSRCTVGSFALCVLLKRMVQSNSVAKGQRILELGSPIFLSKYAISSEDEERHSPMEAKYNVLRNGSDGSRVTLFLGDMHGKFS
jgi:hypothetical protein